MMNKDDAKKIIVDEWRKLPAADRATQDQALMFAMGAKDRYKWRASGDPYQEAMAWISEHIGKP